jgi:photosystem II stability/assembly factor-like uncharacterized protein
MLSILLLFSPLSTLGQNIPMNVQGRVTVDGLVFNGTGKFKFALVLSTGRIVLWTNDGTSAGQNFEPNTSIDLNVVKGLYSVQLGDTNVVGMTKPIDPDIFNNADVRLRIWFNDGTHGFQQLLPDERVGSVGYAYNAQRANQAAILTGSVTIDQVPSILVTNNATNVTLTGTFNGNGSGIFGIRGSTPFQIVNADTNNAFPNTGYLVTNPVQRVVLLPTTGSMNVGDIVRVAGPGSWKIAQQPDQTVFASHFRGGVGATWVPRDASRTWTGVASSTNGLNMVALNYTKLIYLSTNGGMTWTPPQVSPQKNWLSVASSGDGARLIAGAENDLIYISSDVGQSWSQRAALGTRIWTGVCSSSDGTNLVAVAINSPLFTSNDGGDTWAQRPNAGSRNWTAVASSADGTNIFAAADSGLLRSTDKGANWGVLAGTFSSVACSADGQKVIAGVASGNTGGNIYTSNDGGISWLKRDAAGAHLWRFITCSADGSIIAATSPDGISISVDGGGAWTVQAAGHDWRGIACSADATRFVAASFGTGLVNGDKIYTSQQTTLRTTTLGAAGYIAGGEFSAIELQHAGNGKFFPLSSSGDIFAY